MDTQMTRKAQWFLNEALRNLHEYSLIYTDQKVDDAALLIDKVVGELQKDLDEKAIADGEARYWESVLSDEV